MILVFPFKTFMLLSGKFHVIQVFTEIKKQIMHQFILLNNLNHIEVITLLTVINNLTNLISNHFTNFIKKIEESVKKCCILRCFWRN